MDLQFEADVRPERGFSIYQIEATAAIKGDWHPNLVLLSLFNCPILADRSQDSLRILGTKSTEKLNFSMEHHISYPKL